MHINPAYVYLAVGELPGLVKIGMSSTPENRVKEFLQVWGRSTILRQYKFPSFRHAIKAERAALRTFNQAWTGHSVHGEFFEASDILLLASRLDDFMQGVSRAMGVPYHAEG